MAVKGLNNEMGDLSGQARYVLSHAEYHLLATIVEGYALRLAHSQNVDPNLMPASIMEMARGMFEEAGDGEGALRCLRASEGIHRRRHRTDRRPLWKLILGR